MSNVKKPSTRKPSPISAQPASGPTRPETERDQREGDAMSATALKVVQPIPTQLMKADLPQQWANKINGHLKTSVESILAMGRDLIAAKKQLGHGKWRTMFAGRPDSVPEPLRFGRTTAHYLMNIANNRILSNVQHAEHLPPSWYTLSQLATIEEARLEQAITDGEVTPEMSRKDVKKLRPAKAPQGWNLDGARFRLNRAIDRELQHCKNKKDRYEIGALLRQRAHYLRPPSETP
jgi:hypothetical protein